MNTRFIGYNRYIIIAIVYCLVITAASLDVVCVGVRVNNNFRLER